MNPSRYVRYPQRRLSGEAALGALAVKGGARFLRKRLSPSISELAALTGSMYGSSAALLADVPWLTPVFGGDAPDLECLQQEYEQLARRLQERYRLRRLAFPSIWAVEVGTSFLLYALVRGLKPDTVIEMGVGNGQSSFYILRALLANGAGTLHSFDIASEAGGLLSEEERAGWDFRLIDHSRAGSSLVAQLASLPRADLCFHDADHDYLAQYFEFGRLWEQLTETGILISDDIDESYALIDFCEPAGRRPEILIDGRKAVGILHRGTEQTG
jgi:predicted O-methyltransferase YrrM